MIKGAVPGAKGGWVTLKDAVKKKASADVPYPTATAIETKGVSETKSEDIIEEKPNTGDVEEGEEGNILEEKVQLDSEAQDES